MENKIITAWILCFKSEQKPFNTKEQRYGGWQPGNVFIMQFKVNNF